MSGCVRGYVRVEMLIFGITRPVGTGVTPKDAIDVEKRKKPGTHLMSSKIEALLRELKKVSNQV